MDKVLFSHNSDDWCTPSSLYFAFMNNSFVDTFPYKSLYNEFDNVYDGKLLFVNPPFSQLDKLPSWLSLQLQHNCKVALLIPSRTDTIYFHRFLKYNPEIIFIRGRLNFNDSKKCAPFPCLLLLFDFPRSREYLYMDLSEIIEYINKICNLL